MYTLLLSLLAAWALFRVLQYGCGVYKIQVDPATQKMIRDRGNDPDYIQGQLSTQTIAWLLVLIGSVAAIVLLATGVI